MVLSFVGTPHWMAQNPILKQRGHCSCKQPNRKILLRHCKQQKKPTSSSVTIVMKKLTCAGWKRDFLLLSVCKAFFEWQVLGNGELLYNHFIHVYTQVFPHTGSRPYCQPYPGWHYYGFLQFHKTKVKKLSNFLCVNLLNLIHVKVVERILHVDSECFSNPETQILYSKLSSQWMMEQRVIKGRVVYENILSHSKNSLNSNRSHFSFVI